jgi:hypothetical protein
VCVLHSGQRSDILTAAARLSGCKFLFVSPQPRDARVALAFNLRQDLIESRIVGRKKERTTEIDAGRVCTGAEPSDNVANINGEIPDQVFRISEILGDLIQCSVRYQ